ncbi:MAG: OmpA family protein [Magnetococcales bacterium]|nr:OmpA family protein [Magnetococcales bacterium]
MKLPATLLALLLTLPGMALAQELPSGFPKIPALKVEAGTLREEAFGEAEIPLPKRDSPHLVRGRHWNAILDFTGVPEETPAAEVWKLLKPSFAGANWEVVHEFPDSSPLAVTLRLRRDGRELWGYLEIGQPREMRVQLVETGASARKHTLKPPAAKPEALADANGDFPFLTPLPGSALFDGGHGKAPLRIAIDDSGQEQMVGQEHWYRHYRAPANGVSTLEFMAVYREALTSAGWNIVWPPATLDRESQGMIAHYAKNGRDVWAVLHGGEDYAFQVADAARGEDWTAQLKRDCRVPLYGVLFEFDKAALRPESESTLARARDTLAALPTLAVEVQGHTDNVGSDGYNVKLSGARAASVMQWLTGHGIPAARLTARGLGKSQPVADNGSEEGRARNRRVELACRK